MNRAWDEVLADALGQTVEKIVSFAPDLLGMLVLLAVGFLVAKVLQRVAGLLLRKMGFDRALERAGVEQYLRRVNLAHAPSQFVGRLTFWFFMLIFVLSAADAVGLESVSLTINTFVGYLPNVIGATVIVVVGLLLSHLVRDIVRGSTAGIGLDYANAVGKLVYGVLIVIVASLAITQLRIETALLNQVLLVLLITAGGALALTLGLGTRDIVRNLVAGIYARERFESGAPMTVGDHTGTLDEVGSVNTLLTAADGERIYIPNGQLLDAVVRSGRTGQRTDTP